MKNINFVAKRKVLMLAGILTMGGFYSCSEDFLDVEPEGQAVSEQFFVTPDQAVQSVTAIYGHLKDFNVSAFPHLAITTIASDDAGKGSVPGDAGYLEDYDNLTFTPSIGLLDGYWVAQYQGINLANQSISNIPAIEMDQALKERLIAEAKFLRAYYYFNLVRTFGGVPLRTTVPVPPTEPEDPAQLNPERASEEAVYEQIIGDLTDASQVLPATYSAADAGRATNGAALALLAKVQLYQKNWSEVLSLTEQVMGMGYSLTPNYHDNFTIAGENNNESIFEIQAQTIPGNCDASNSQWAEVQGVRSQFGWGFVEPTEDLVNAFEEGDERLDATILFRGETTPEGDKIIENAPNPRYNQKAYVPSYVTRQCGYGRDQNIRILRYAEVLLMHSEAANEQGLVEKALFSLNMVRERAGLDPIESASQQELRNIIWHERRVELALENGDRFYDLVRQGRAAEVLQAQGKQFTENKNELYPIPQRQIDLSGGTLTQNPGY
ncbi:RagB/SusD family nutrient uptake outer membrane protein [Pontibacter silvestris]|uniref:RagB/SusD family nutrient uptake outer membrane protein n=1 Tax=Pontibacter silvestris TaxID=2305183 RepID=A0ABW4X394_9BACT|nr:RagB/SusD family nutrient uptake outer membrane protein [Pontibacter silvestris]MCC9137887.1 RagB/SusD family nutrient uptake outer membrane protein [Pontibacter silvestris]